jgi:hypothetical protein
MGATKGLKTHKDLDVWQKGLDPITLPKTFLSMKEMF